MSKQNKNKKYQQKFKPVIFRLLPYICAYIFPFSQATAQVKDDNPGIFYSITGNGLKDTSYLFGTYHLVNSSYVTEMPQVTKCFNKTKGVITEIVMDSSKLGEIQLMSIMEEKKLSQILEKPFSDTLEKELKNTMGVGLAQVDKLKPMTLTLTMSLVYLMKNNNERLQLYKGVPLDVYFVNEAKIKKKDINPFETMEEQMNMLFNKTSIDDQVTQLKIFIRNKEKAVQMGDELLDSWFNKDLKRMYNIYKNMAQVTGDQDYLVKDRNNNWMKTLPRLLGKESQFIAVGALHLAGPEGLIEQLKHLGYTVTPIK